MSERPLYDDDVETLELREQEGPRKKRDLSSELGERQEGPIEPLAGAPVALSHEPAPAFSELDCWVDWRSIPEVPIWDRIADDHSEGSGGGFILLNKTTRDRMCAAAAAGKSKNVIAARAGVTRRNLTRWLHRGAEAADALERWEDEGCVRRLTESERRDFCCADLMRRLEIARSYGEESHYEKMLEQGSERNDFRAQLEFLRANYDGWTPKREQAVSGSIDHTGEVKLAVAPAAELVDSAYEEFRAADAALEAGEDTVDGTAEEIDAGSDSSEV